MAAFLILAVSTAGLGRFGAELVRVHAAVTTRATVGRPRIERQAAGAGCRTPRAFPAGTSPPPGSGTSRPKVYPAVSVVRAGGVFQALGLANSDSGRLMVLLGSQDRAD